MDTTVLALPPKALQNVQRILAAHAPKHRAFAFGSRVVSSKAAAKLVKRHADIDIALDGPSLPLETLFELREAFSESDLQMRVDVMDAADIPATWDIRRFELR